MFWVSGNTCFMNAALQCLLHIPELEQYFLKSLHQRELNPSNPLGMKGQFATSFAILMQHMYPAAAKPASRSAPSEAANSGYQTTSAKRGAAFRFNATSQPPRPVGSASSYAPRNFKHTVCQFAPVFAGYEENDSQELLGTVLDGLHEDLNRVLKKPSVKKPEWPEEDSGSSRAELEARIARETWEGHARRNNSVIADLFQGMYKSTLKCPSCGKVSQGACLLEWGFDNSSFRYRSHSTHLCHLLSLCRLLGPRGRMPSTLSRGICRSQHS
jgi:ubiquitin carboxyl-terminal hydrolase 4/11/15